MRACVCNNRAQRMRQRGILNIQWPFNQAAVARCAAGGAFKVTWPCMGGWRQLPGQSKLHGREGSERSRAARCWRTVCNQVSSGWMHLLQPSKSSAALSTSRPAGLADVRCRLRSAPPMCLETDVPDSDVRSEDLSIQHSVCLASMKLVPHNVLPGAKNPRSDFSRSPTGLVAGLSGRLVIRPTLHSRRCMHHQARPSRHLGDTTLSRQPSAAGQLGLGCQ